MIAWGCNINRCVTSLCAPSHSILPITFEINISPFFQRQIYPHKKETIKENARRKKNRERESVRRGGQASASRKRPAEPRLRFCRRRPDSDGEGRARRKAPGSGKWPDVEERTKRKDGKEGKRENEGGGVERNISEDKLTKTKIN